MGLIFGITAIAQGFEAPATPILTAGAARVNITPDPAMQNRMKQEPYGTVVDSLYARALVLSDGNRQVAILALDIVSTSEPFVSGVRDAVQQATGIPGSNVLINASHSHSTPWGPRPRRRPNARADTARSVAPDTTRRTVLDSSRAAAARRRQPDPIYDAWASNLTEDLVGAVKRAQTAGVPVTLSIGRAYAGEWMFNRRTIRPDGSVTTTFRPENPYALPEGLRFGKLDPTLTVLSLTDADSSAVATVFSVPCHAVSSYDETVGLSAGWPGAACRNIERKLGGEAMFLQGCAGDIVPAKRGLKATATMGQFFGSRATMAQKRGLPLRPARLSVVSEAIALPLNERGKRRSDSSIRQAEIQVITYGSLALVALPGEPLNALAGQIQDRSPYPHTVVIGYSNGGGVGYVGLPGERAKGGYEAEVARGADECGVFLIETASRVLADMHAAQMPEDVALQD